MSNYRRGTFDFVVDSSFQPFSMQELLTPYMMYKDAYEQTENVYSDLQQKACVWEGMANEESDPETYKQYKKFADDLRVQAEDLAHHGLSINNRRQLLDLKRRYTAEITPIEQAYANRKAQMKEQHDLLLQDPTRLFSREARLSSLDDYMKNPQLDYRQYSGALLAKQVSDVATNISKSLVDYVNGKPLDGNTRTWLQKHGLTAMEVAQAISNPQSMQSSKVLNTLMNSVIESSGITEWADPALLKRAYLYASQGLWKAVGEDKVGTYRLPQGKQSLSRPAVEQSVQIPNLIPVRNAQAPQQPQVVAGNSSGSGKKGRRYSYALGGNLYEAGGPQKVKISPYLGQMLDQMDDNAYNAFIAEQAGTSNYSEVQEDSVLQAYDKQLAESMQAQYLRKLFEENYPEVEQVSPSYNLRNVLTTLEDTQTAQDTKMWKKYGKYFAKDPKTGLYSVNNEGKKAYNAGFSAQFLGVSHSIGVPIYSRESETNDFKQWIDRHHLSEMAKGRTSKLQSNIVNSMQNRINNNYDATLATEYYRPLDSDQYQDILVQLHILATEGKLPSYERVKSNGSYAFKAKDDKIAVDNLENKVRGVAVVYGEHGNYLEVAIKGGKKIYVPFDKINSYYDQIVRSNIQRAKSLRELQKTGTKVTLKSDGKTIEPIEISINRALNAAGNNMISAFSTSGVKKQEVERNTYR